MTVTPRAAPSVIASGGPGVGTEELAASADLNTFFDVSLDLLVVRELDGRVVKASRAWFASLGYQPGEIEGQGLLRLVHPDDMPGTLGSIVEVEERRPGDPVLGHVNRYRHKAGHYVTLEWRAQRFGERIYAVARDVTEKVAAERALMEAKAAAEEASRAKSDFLANMSHEIRTPLNGVIGIVDALSRTELTPAQAEMVGLVSASGVTLERLVSDILDMSKVEAGQLQIEVRPFDIDDALAAPLDTHRRRAEARGLQFVVLRGADVSGVFMGDSTRIRQVLDNLLSNAVKFTSAGSITVRLALDQIDQGRSCLDFEVVDTGVGFDSEQAERLFDRFSQADSTITRRFGGTGLGLSICQAMVELMGGRVTAASTPGAGSRFRVSLPLTRAAEGALRKDGHEAAPLRPLRVLLAEDHPTNQRVVQLILASQGASVVTVEDGAGAVAAFASDTFDLVLMDMQMPGMDGLTATRALRQLEADLPDRPRTPIIMLSANAMAEHREQGLAAGCDAHIAKPITAASLLSGIRTLGADICVSAAEGDNEAPHGPSSTGC